MPKASAGSNRDRLLRPPISLPLARRLLYRVLSYTPTEIHPVTGSGAALLLRPISTPKRELDGVPVDWHRVRDSNPRNRTEIPVSWASLDERDMAMVVPPATNRTRGLPLTRRLLCLLSYEGKGDPLRLCPNASIPSDVVSRCT